jgi:prepilin-type N-terminal cleavage/methylation domain-containing protein
MRKLARKRPSGRCHEAGFTLVELIISIGLFSLVSVAILSAGLQYSRSFARLSAEADLARYTRFFQSTFANDVRGAASVSKPSPTSLLLSLPDASTIRYELSTTGGGQARLVRIHGNQTVVMLHQVADWSVTLPSSTSALETSILVLYRDPSRGIVIHPLSLRIAPRAHVL